MRSIVLCCVLAAAASAGCNPVFGLDPVSQAVDGSVEQIDAASPTDAGTDGPADLYVHLGLVTASVQDGLLVANVRANAIATVWWESNADACYDVSQHGIFGGWENLGAPMDSSGTKEIEPLFGADDMVTIGCVRGSAAIIQNLEFCAMQVRVDSEMPPTRLYWAVPIHAGENQNDYSCRGIAMPQVGGGLANGGAYGSSGEFAFFNPGATSDQGFVCYKQGNPDPVCAGWVHMRVGPP